MVNVTVAFKDPELDEQELEVEVQRLRSDLKNLDEVDAVSRPSDPNPPKGSKSPGSFLMGVLTAEVSMANAKQLFSFLGDRLSNKPIELQVEANGRKLSVKASSRAELEAAIQAAKDFVDG